MQKIIFKFQKYIFALTVFFMSLYFIWSSRNLRPIADDYCHAARASAGFWKSLNFWFTTWTSDFFAIMVNYFLLAFPLLHWPYSISSAFTFFSSIFVLALLAYYFVYNKFNLKDFLIFIPVVIVSYISFWMTSNIFFGETIFQNLSNMIFNWQIINSQFIFLTCLLLLFFFRLLKIHFMNKTLSLFIIVFGFLAGTFGVVLGLTVLSMVLIVIVKSLLEKNPNLFLKMVLLAFSMSMGLLFSLISPGSQVRAKILRDGWITQSFDLVILFKWTFPTAIFEFFQGIMHAGSLVVILFGVLSGVLLIRSNNQVHRKKTIEDFLILFNLAFLASIVSQLSEAFSYVAFWHLVIPYLLIYLSLFLLGVIIGKSSDLFVVNPALLATILFLTLGISTANLSKVSSETLERRLLWQVGPAPILGISDIESKSDWVFDCWMDMKKYKGYPDRENF